MTKVCVGVYAYECFFFQSKENAGTDENHPNIKGKVLLVIYKYHFANNADLLQAIKPTADAIGLLESPYSTIASIYLIMIQLYNLYTGVKGNKFFDHVKTCITKCFDQYFSHSIFSFQYFCGPNIEILVYQKTVMQIG